MSAGSSSQSDPSDAGNRRKANRAGEATAPGVAVIDGIWHIRSLPVVRHVLRASGATTQAGFNAESVPSGQLRRPVLFLDGPEHRTQRSLIARYFAPKTVGTRYRSYMEALADELIATVEQAGEVDLSELTLGYAVRVAAQVVGLTESDYGGMGRRLERVVSLPRIPPSGDGRTARLRIPAVFLTRIYSQAHLLPFFLRDVRPAISVRRRAPREDVISHLIAQGYRPAEILIECITYGAAGMVTTREYISMATWHLLENPEVRADYLRSAEPRRLEILKELLRLEPIVGHLYRRTTAPITLHDGEEAHHVPAGALLDLYVRQANADPEYVGPSPLRVCPDRNIARPYPAEVMSFGDGTHRCPGHAIAMLESDILLSRLLRLPLTITSAPHIGWEELITGYQVRHLQLRVDRSAGCPRQGSDQAGQGGQTDQA